MFIWRPEGTDSVALWYFWRNVSIAPWHIWKISASLRTGSWEDDTLCFWHWGFSLPGHGWGYMATPRPFLRLREVGGGRENGGKAVQNTGGRHSSYSSGRERKDGVEGDTALGIIQSSEPGPGFVNLCQWPTPWRKRKWFWWLKEIILTENWLPSSCNSSSSSSQFQFPEPTTWGRWCSVNDSKCFVFEGVPCCSYYLRVSNQG